MLEPILEDRFVKGGGYRGTRLRRVGICIFANVVSLMVGQRVSDTTSGFRAVDRKALRLFAAQYPHNYPEVESMVLLLHVDDLGIELGNLLHSDLSDTGASVKLVRKEPLDARCNRTGESMFSSPLELKRLAVRDQVDSIVAKLSKIVRVSVRCAKALPSND